MSDNPHLRWYNIIGILVLAGLCLSLYLAYSGLDPLRFFKIPEILYADIFVWIFAGLVIAIFSGPVILSYNQKFKSPSETKVVDPDTESLYAWEREAMVIDTYDRTIARCIQALRQFEWEEITEYNYNSGHVRAYVSVPSSMLFSLQSLVTFSIKRVSSRKSRVRVTITSPRQEMLLLSEDSERGTKWTVGSNVAGGVKWDPEILTMHYKMKNFEVLETIISHLQEPADKEVRLPPLPAVNSIDASGKFNPKDLIHPMDVALLSIIFPGIGTTITGRPVKGILIALATAAGTALFLVPGLVICGYGIRDAYLGATDVNNGSVPFRPASDWVLVVHLIVIGITMPIGIYFLVWLCSNYQIGLFNF